MDIFDTVALEVDERVQWLKDNLASGKLTPEEYQAICGEIKGLLYVKQYMKDLKQNLENSDDE